MRHLLRILFALILPCSYEINLTAHPGDDPMSDSLGTRIEQLTAEKKFDQVVLEYYYQGASLVAKGDYVAAKSPFEAALNIAEQYRLDSLSIEILYQLGYAQYLTGDFPSALQHFQKIVAQNEKNVVPGKTGTSYAQISSIYRSLGDIGKSLEYQQLAMKDMEANQDSVGMAFHLYQLSATFYEQESFDQSLIFIDSAIHVARHIGWEQMIFTCIAGKGNTLMKQGNLDSAFVYAHKARAYADKIHYPVGVAYSSTLLGEIFSYTEKTDSAMFYLDKAISQNRDLGYRVGEISSLISIGRMHARTGDFDKARDVVLQALEYTDELGLSRHTDNILGLLAEIYFKSDDLRNAYYYQTLDKKLHDSIFNESVSKQIAALEVSSKIREIENKQELVIQKEKARFYLFGGIISFVLISIVALLLFSRNRLQAHTNALLNAKNRELARTNKELEQFAYVASHDLKEPLRMIASYTGLLKRRYSHLFDKDAHEYMGFVSEGVNRMDALLKDLMVYATIDEGEIHYENTDVEQIVHSSIKLLRPTIEETGATIEVSWLPRIKANSSQISQLFINLISNALKYRSSVPPVIRVESRETEKEVVFSIKDNGIGIEEAYWEKIFSIFQRLHQREQYEGTGIGLAICRKIVENHKGKIWVESSPGKGSTFFVSLPRNL
ncbi:MAG: ATP-binding protein [Bacteroidia bacterium]